jgi:hypothetical protein
MVVLYKRTGFESLYSAVTIVLYGMYLIEW